MEYIPDAVCVNHWVDQAKDGDSRQTEALASYLRQLLVRRFSQLGLNAEQSQELAQECLIDIIQNLAKFDAARGTLSSWVSGFARTSVRSWRRREYGRAANETPLDGAPEVASQDAAISQVEDVVTSSLSGLNIIDQELIYMRFCLGLSFDEIASKATMTSANARKRLSRAVDRLRRDPALRETLGL